MKLLMITGLGSARDLASGKRGAFYNTLEEFSKYWTRIDIICPKLFRGSTSKQEVEPLFGNVYIHISPWPLAFHPIFFIKKALEIYKEQKFDLMTVHEFPPFYNGIAARILWQFLKVPYVLEIFHIPGYPRVSSLKENIYKLIFKLFIKLDASKARAIRIMNSQVSDFLIKTGVPQEKIVNIPAIYVDLGIFRSTINDQPIRQDFDGELSRTAQGPEFTEGRPTTKEYDLIFIGRLEKNKGIDLLLDAFKILNTKYKIQDTKLLIVGDGSLRKKLELQATSYKLQAKFHGWAKDSQEIAELINKSKILVMPSYNEGGPRVVVEAFACGVPVLATPVGMVPDLLKNKQGGEIIDWNANDILEKIQGLLSDSDKYQKYSQNGPEIAKQFEKKAAIRNYAERLKNLL